MQLQKAPETTKFQPELMLNPAEIRAIIANSSSLVTELPHIEFPQLQTKGMGATRGSKGRTRREQRKSLINTPPEAPEKEKPPTNNNEECQDN
jgi:hypothetical protein